MIYPIVSKTKHKSTKDNIITILSLKQPLTAKEIFNLLHREYENEVSYQGVHKTILQLVEEGIIEKNDKKYQINKEWVKRVSSFGRRLEENSQEIIKTIDEKGSVTLNFLSYIEFGRFLVNEFFNNFPNTLGVSNFIISLGGLSNNLDSYLIFSELAIAILVSFSCDSMACAAIF